MKTFLVYFLAALFSVSGVVAQTMDQQINVVSFNIRLDADVDAENQWTHRKDYAADLIKFYEVDIFGAQEVQHHQLTDLLERLPGFGYVGVGREDGKTKGEYAPIFYKKERFAVLKNGDFWLAEDMNAVGKKGWDAACERVVSWAIFKDKITGKEFFFLNTHLDHVGKIARHEGASLVLEQVRVLSGDLPVIVTGDFNATPDDDPIQVLTKSDDPRHLTHARDISPIKYGPEWTFHNYGRIPAERRSWIDYIFIKGNIQAQRYGVLTESMGHLYPSDHCPVLTTLTIR
ncbi:endonuclease/exonuclease/phosphatase family protein [Parabacteroides sp. PF5-9]|uniref:endonuclease/exonuclease/phosphatase family protein n=1 Tax=Parabacteroides sp. PF5-9 TaxID=1742404 RepID=UPI0024744A22|nr:endonuclease/exonuclease/phosphatase family protein [Parabacteroides sp. PF5-9]MDH6356711.1 endonuclease/exonuclease/phosphatase family metal-dependent hydrolase [Parabacteroides sp. PF5-9]